MLNIFSFLRVARQAAPRAGICSPKMVLLYVISVLKAHIPLQAQCCALLVLSTLTPQWLHPHVLQCVRQALLFLEQIMDVAIATTTELQPQQILAHLAHLARKVNMPLRHQTLIRRCTVSLSAPLDVPRNAQQGNTKRLQFPTKLSLIYIVSSAKMEVEHLPQRSLVLVALQESIFRIIA